MLDITSTKPRVISNSIPKAGTYLLKKCLSLFPGLSGTNVHLEMGMQIETMSGLLSAAADGNFATAHLPYQKAYARMFQELQYKTLLIIRDPRDVVVSFSYYVTKSADHYLNAYYRNLSGDDERLMVSIIGIKEKLGPWVPWANVLYDIDRLYDVFLGWSDETMNCTVRFESLIGPMGGGSRESQVQEIGRIANHLGIKLSPADVEHIAKGTFDRMSPTFRQGVVGDWRNHLSPEHKKVFKDIAGHLLIDLGYEKNLDW